MGLALIYTCWIIQILENHVCLSVEGPLCYDEATNEFVYVNMIQSNLNGAESLSAVSQSVFSALGGSSTSLADLSTFGDGSQVLS